MNSQFPDQPVIVGFDGSEHAHLALRWAVDEACRLKAPVVIAYVIEWLREFTEVLSDATNARVRREAQATGEAALAAAVAAVHELGSDVPVSTVIQSGPPATVLCDLSSRARMLVVGSRGHGGFAGLWTGSVSAAVATHAHCPVVVVRRLSAAGAQGPVVVGVDESAQARMAAQFAFAEAASRGVAVIAVRAWKPPTGLWSDGQHSRGEALAEVETAEHRVLDEILDPVCHAYPGVPVQRRLIAEGAGTALVAVAAEAQLAVVGSRGRGGFAGLLLGSVSMQLLHHAACPVAIVREIHADRMQQR